MEKMRKPALFSLGGLGYVGLELLWRGRSHGSMFLAGGVCFLLLGRLKTDRLWKMGLQGTLTVTGVELVTGLLFNRDYRVWDYRAQPWTFLGQICLLYSLLWIPVSIGACWLYRKLDRK